MCTLKKMPNIVPIKHFVPNRSNHHLNIAINFKHYNSLGTGICYNIFFPSNLKNDFLSYPNSPMEDVH